MGHYRGRNSGSGSGVLLAPRVPLCVLEKCAPLGDRGLVSRALDRFLSSPRAPLFSTQVEQLYTAILFSVRLNPTFISSTPKPGLVLLHTAGSWTPIQVQDRWCLV